MADLIRLADELADAKADTELALADVDDLKARLEHQRMIAGDNARFAWHYRNLLQTLLDKGTLSPIDAAEIDAALSWVGD
tara:strand:- start:2807 stop:3046 length:240 start_codon:yes stop_codon:yes gene_type:complete